MNVPVSMMASTDGILGNGYEEVKEFTGSWSQNLVNTRSKKSSNAVYKS